MSRAKIPPSYGLSGVDVPPYFLPLHGEKIYSCYDDIVDRFMTWLNNRYLMLWIDVTHYYICMRIMTLCCQGDKK